MAQLTDFYPSEYWVSVQRQLDRLGIPADAKISTRWGQLTPRAALNALANWHAFRISAIDREGIPTAWGRRQREDQKALNALRRAADHLQIPAMQQEEIALRKQFEQTRASMQEMFTNEPTADDYLNEIIKIFGLTDQPVGDESGPLVQFLITATRPVLKRETPTASALRGRLRRR